MTMRVRDGRAVKPVAANTSDNPRTRARFALRPVSRHPAAAAAIRTLKDEHLAIAAVLYGLRVAVRALAERGAAWDLAPIAAMLDYIVAFPERLHHPKETRYLFKALMARCPRARPLIHELEGEHVRGAALIESLQARLAQYRQGRATRDALAQAVDDYAEFHWQHMEKEETLLLPLALRNLVVADWVRISAAFRENDNPLIGVRPKEEADVLFRRIVGLMQPGSAADVVPRHSGTSR